MIGGAVGDTTQPRCLPANSALLTDAYLALRASFGAAKRGR